MSEPTLERYQQAFAYLSQNLSPEIPFDPKADPMLFVEAIASDQQGFTDYLANVMPDEVVALLQFIESAPGPNDTNESLQEELDDLVEEVLELYPDNPWATPEIERLDS